MPQKTPAAACTSKCKLGRTVPMNWVYLITGLDYWTGPLDWTSRPHPFIVLLDFILKSKQATALKLCNLIYASLQDGKVHIRVWYIGMLTNKCGSCWCN